MRLERMLTRSLNLCFSSGLTTTSHPGPQEVMDFDGSAHACNRNLATAVHTLTQPLSSTADDIERINTSLGAVLTRFNTSTAVVLTVNV